MKTLEIEIEKLLPADYNPRSMPVAEMEKLVASIQKFGMVEPIVVNSDLTVIGGHQRLQAAKQIGLASVPCIQIEISKPEEKILNMALNKIHGTWDEDKLSRLIADLAGDVGADLGLSGFDANEIGSILGELDAGAFDRVNSTPEDFDTRYETFKFDKPDWIELNKAIEIVQSGGAITRRPAALAQICREWVARNNEA